MYAAVPGGIWGKTVNLASRMQSTSQPPKAALPVGSHFNASLAPWGAGWGRAPQLRAVLSLGRIQVSEHFYDAVVTCAVQGAFLLLGVPTLTLRSRTIPPPLRKDEEEVVMRNGLSHLNFGAFKRLFFHN